MSKLQTKLSGWQIRTVKTIIFVILCFLLFRLFNNRVSVPDLLHTLAHINLLQTAGCLLVITFMPINWGLEAIKWQLLLRNIQPVSFKKAFSSVISGTALANLTPFMLGDFVGRLRSLQAAKRMEGGMALLFGNGVQTYVLLVAGLISWLLVFQQIGYQFSTLPVAIGLFLLVLIGTAYFFKIVQLPFAAKFRIITIVNDYRKNSILRLLSIAFLRQFLFSIQFIMLLKIFGVQLPFYLLLSLVSLIFVFKTLGSFAGIWGDMILRQLSAVYLFGLFSVVAEPVLIATTLLWLINIFIPMVSGLVVLFYSPMQVQMDKIA